VVNILILHIFSGGDKNMEMAQLTPKAMTVLKRRHPAGWPLGSVPQTMAETWNAKFFNRVTKVEGLPITDVEGHLVGMFVREGVTIYASGELTYSKTVVIFDGTNGVGPFL
jgi:hypothetical protein